MKPSLIELHALAPVKPDRGAPCNGCGVCCAAEPCPVAIGFLFQRRGRCRALQWQPNVGRYVCGMVAAPKEVLPLLPQMLVPMARRFFASRIAAGCCCDADIETSDDVMSSIRSAPRL